MINIDKLTQIINGHLEADEKIEAKIAGRTIVNNGAGEEIVDGLIGATEHRIFVLINSISINNRRIWPFAFTQVQLSKFDESENKFHLIVSEKSFVFTDVLRNPNPQELIQFINNKKPLKSTLIDIRFRIEQ